MAQTIDEPLAGPLSAAAAPAAATSSILVLINPASGGVAKRGAAAIGGEIAAAFAAHGCAVEIVTVPGEALAEQLRARIAPPAAPPRAIVAVGGDGTVSTLAQELADGSIPLGILPLGTLNHFARDLGLPLDIPGAIAVIVAGSTRQVDLGAANGRIFVNNSSVGLYPEMVRDRERQRRQSRRARWLAMLLAIIRVLRRPPVRRLRILGAGWVKPRKTPFAFVGNNLYGLDLFTIGRRASLEDGMLCLFLADTIGARGLIRLILRAAFGRLEQSRDFERHCLAELTIDSRRRRLRVSFDGEIARLRPPIHYRSRPGALRVLAPPRWGR
jgi:diacylglycerol kinase family enzyme